MTQNTSRSLGHDTVRNALDWIQENRYYGLPTRIVTTSEGVPDSTAVVGSIPELLAEADSAWDGEMDKWGVELRIEVLPYFGHVLIVEMVGPFHYLSNPAPLSL